LPEQSDGVTSRAVAWWHGLLCVIAGLNITLWLLSALAITRAHGVAHADSDLACRLQLLLSAAYVLGCAFRSALPVYDIPRLVLVDTRLSSVFVGRSVATVAELCFAAQWALILHGVAWLSGSTFGQTAAWTLVPLILLAEGFSWHAVLTTAQRGHVFENSLWGLSAALVIASLLAIGPQRLEALYPPMIAWCVGGALYVAFIFFLDVPMYWSRWLADQARHRRYFSLAQGLADVRSRGTVSYRWGDWKSEVLWMSLYFTFGVWSSIALVYASLALAGHGN
jgi:hypothetical protein